MADVPPNKPIPGVRDIATLEISTAADGLSAAMNLGGRTLAAIEMSTAWTDAPITFKGSIDGETYFDLYDDDGTEVTVTTTASRLVRLDPVPFMGLSHLKFNSGDASTDVAQTATRVLKLSLVG